MGACSIARRRISVKHKFIGLRMDIECMTLPCVTQAVKDYRTRNSLEPGCVHALINPANTALIGTQLPYFPRGGPVPKAPPRGLSNSVAGWGGMEGGDQMLYPVQAVDGVVHRLGGKALRSHLEAFPSNGQTDEVGQPLRCQLGEAVVTPGCGDLDFDLVAHTVPPFWAHEDWETLLRRCYSSSLANLARAASSTEKSAAAAPLSLCVASPILGAGARGAPKTYAVRAAAMGLFDWLVNASVQLDVYRTSVRVCFVVLPEAEHGSVAEQCGGARRGCRPHELHSLLCETIENRATGTVDVSVQVLGGIGMSQE